MFGWLRRYFGMGIPEGVKVRPMFPGVCALNATIRERNPDLWQRVGGLSPCTAFREIGAHYGLDAAEVERAARLPADTASVWMIDRIEAAA
jgi:hypothetical protein